MKVNTKLLVRLALLAAISLILGKFLSFKLEPWGRVSLENLTVIMAGYLYGPLAGIICGTVGDIVGCLAYGYPINPIITVGAAMVGGYAGVFGLGGIFKKPRLFLSVIAAHATGSLLIKSLGIYLYYATPIETLIMRLPIYIVTGAIEYILLSIMFRNRGLRALMEN
ncbi:MAG: folate family ECF transporter S component [Clostridia bacterium]|nr:folate family ECF transporter S component [Clostridia bacterium]